MLQKKFHAPVEYTIWSRDKFQNGYFNLIWWKKLPCVPSVYREFLHFHSQFGSTIDWIVDLGFKFDRIQSQQSNRSDSSILMINTINFCMQNRQRMRIWTKRILHLQHGLFLCIELISKCEFYLKRAHVL